MTKTGSSSWEAGSSKTFLWKIWLNLTSEGSDFKTSLSSHHMWCHLALSSVVKYRPEHHIQAWRDPWSMPSASSTACRRCMRWWGAGDYPPSYAMRIIILQQDSRTENMVGDWAWWKVVDLWTHFRPKQRGGNIVPDDNLGFSGFFCGVCSEMWSCVQ